MKFIDSRVRRIINMYGRSFIFTRMGEDQYHQPIEVSKISIRGLYHETIQHITVSTSDSAELRRKSSPMILALLTDEVKSLKQGDFTMMSGVKYRVTGIEDIQNLGTVADISLEMTV